MPLLGFTKLKDKLLDGSKTQTIRKPRKHPIQVGDKLYVYWKLRTKECEKLGLSKIVKIERKYLIELTEEEVRKDVFLDRRNLTEWFLGKYGKNVGEMQFDVITFEPIRKES